MEDAGQIDRAAEGYAGQLNLYRRALSRILDVPESGIDCRLAFTRPGVVRDVPPER